MEPKQINRENFFDFLWVNYTELIGQGYMEKPLEYNKLFREENSNGAYEKYKEVNGLPVWEENFEGQPYHEVDRGTGYDMIIENKRFDQSYKITWEYLDDNKEKIMNGQGVDLAGATMMGRGCRVEQELTAAAIINTGFDNVGYDGVALFDDAHPLAGGKTASNLVEAEALTDAVVKEALELAFGQVDNMGYKIQCMPNQFFVSADLWFTALTITKSAQVAGSQLNDKNVLPPFEVIMMSYFDKGIAILRDTSFRNLIFQWRNKPEFGYYNIQGTADYKVWGRARWGVGYIDWRGLVGIKIEAA